MPLRCLVRRPEHLRPKVATSTEVVQGDLLERETLDGAMRGVHTAFYLVHSMGHQADFADADRSAARNFAEAAAAQGVSRIIYLGGLGSGNDGELSEHLRSRREVGEILRAGTVPTLELRSSIILGSGSISFELIRALVDRLPVMITPRWVQVRTQPIAIEDVLDYLERARDLALEESMWLEIGGPDRVSYGELMREYAEQRGLRRRILPLPVLSPRLSSLWLGLVTPIYARIGRELIDGVRNETIVEDESALRLFDLRPRGVREAIERALVHEEREFAETRWCDALSATRKRSSYGGETFGSRIIDSRSVFIPAQPSVVFTPVRRIGGSRGWPFGGWLWRLRGWIDLLSGGVGMRRGRRDPEWPAVGEPLDFWRVEALERDRLLRLRAEMKVPGQAWLQFEVEPEGSGSRLRQTAIFKPRGLGGIAYWYALYPVHAFIFGGMLRELARRATPTQEEVSVELLSHK